MFKIDKILKKLPKIVYTVSIKMEKFAKVGLLKKMIDWNKKIKYVVYKCW